MPWLRLWQKCFWGAVIITGTEFIFGMFFNRKFNMAVWDYSALPLNILGQICLPFSALWFLLCFILFKWIIKEDFYRRFF